MVVLELLLLASAELQAAALVPHSAHQWAVVQRFQRLRQELPGGSPSALAASKDRS
jgi:hypothetical protein